MFSANFADSHFNISLILILYDSDYYFLYENFQTFAISINTGQRCNARIASRI